MSKGNKNVQAAVGSDAVGSDAVAIAVEKVQAPPMESAEDFLDRLGKEFPDGPDGLLPEYQNEPIEFYGDTEATDNSDIPVIDSFRQEVMENPDMVWSLDPNEIIIDPARNGRTSPRLETDADVKELAKAIAQDGQMQPGEVLLDIDGRMYLTFGFGRIAAVNLLNKTRGPAAEQLPFKAYVRTGFDTATGRVRNANENWKRKELTILDKAQIVADLMNPPFSLNQTQVAQRLGLVKATVSNFVKVQGFPDSVKTLMRDEKLGRKAAMDLCALPADKIEETAAKLVAESGGSVITARAVKKKAATVAPSKTKQLDMKEFIEVLDFILEKQNAKQLHKSTEEIVRIIGDVVYGRASQAVALKRLASYQ